MPQRFNRIHPRGAHPGIDAKNHAHADGNSKGQRDGPGNMRRLHRANDFGNTGHHIGKCRGDEIPNGANHGSTGQSTANAQQSSSDGQGDGFGEEALVSDTPRNASVTMRSSGVLMRLDKESFIELIRDPLINRISFQDARRMIDEGAV